MHPRVKAVVAYRCFEAGMRPEKVLNTNHRKPKIVKVRHAIIHDLFDPASRNPRVQRRFVLGASEIGRQIGMDHSTVINALKKAPAVYGGLRDG